MSLHILGRKIFLWFLCQLMYVFQTGWPCCQVIRCDCYTRSCVLQHAWFMNLVKCFVSRSDDTFFLRYQLIGMYRYRWMHQSVKVKNLMGNAGTQSQDRYFKDWTMYNVQCMCTKIVQASIYFLCIRLFFIIHWVG